MWLSDNTQTALAVFNERYHQLLSCGNFCFNFFFFLIVGGGRELAVCVTDVLLGTRNSVLQEAPAPSSL